MIGPLTDSADGNCHKERSNQITVMVCTMTIILKLGSPQERSISFLEYRLRRVRVCYLFLRKVLT